LVLRFDVAIGSGQRSGCARGLHGRDRNAWLRGFGHMVAGVLRCVGGGADTGGIESGKRGYAESSGGGVVYLVVVGVLLSCAIKHIKLWSRAWRGGDG